MTNILLYLLIFIGSLFGLGLRFYYINFGLPHSFYADEPEIVELAIKYTFEFRDIIQNNNWYKVFPISYVYGTFPIYFYTLCTMAASKFTNMLGFSLNKMDFYVLLRSINAVLTFLIGPVTSIIVYKLSKNKSLALVTFLGISLNWKLIVMSHYVNNDILLTLFLLLSFLFLFEYQETSKNDKLFTTLSAIFLGLAAGTKITALISLPAYFYIFAGKRNYKNLVAFCLISLGVFIVTNPFSLVFKEDFIFRLYEMVSKEGGMVFDSIDLSKLKYLEALIQILTLPVLVISLYGIFAKVFSKNLTKVDHFFIINLIIYLVFYSLQERRVDRWVLPIIPIFFIYASHGTHLIWSKIHSFPYKTIFFVAVTMAALIYLEYPVLLLQQFKRNTPKSEAYLWARENIPTPISDIPTRLAYTEEGLDPLNKLPDTKVIIFEVYTSDNAQLSFPQDPSMYEYIFISSRPMENFKRPEVKQTYPYYAERWQEFENTLLNPNKFELIKEFTLPKPNIIPLSDVFVFKNLTYK